MIYIKPKVTIAKIRQSLYDAYLDTEYREALAHTLINLKYVSDSPLNLYYGTEKQKEELQQVDTMPLDSNQISEIIHLMMLEMRNDFQYGNFKPVAMEYLDISEKMKSINESKQKHSQIEKIKCNVYETFGDINKIICRASLELKKNNLYDESREMIEKATTAYSYDDALNIVKEYVEIIDKENVNEEEDEFE